MTAGINFYTLKVKDKIKILILKEYKVGIRIACIK